MLSMNTKTKLKPEEVVKKALDFFGPGGYGLTVTNQSDTCISFEGGGGGVDISTCADGKETSVDMETREWEIQIKDFAAKIS
jgi:hypothetical protein